MKRRYGSAISVVIVLLLLFVVFGGSEEHDYELVRAEFGDLNVTIEATGKLEAAVAFEIGPPSMRDTWRYNLTWMIPEGRKVKKGAAIARFDPTDLDDRLRESRADLETTQQEKEKEERNLQVALKKLRLDLVKAEGEAKKVSLDAAVPAELVSSIEMEQTRLKKALDEKRVGFLKEKMVFEQDLVDSKLALLDVKQTFHQGRIDYYEQMKGRYEVKAPVDGLIVYVPKRDNQRWEIGESVWMMAKIMKVADVKTLQVEAAVLEVDAARIQPGQLASINVDALPGLNVESSVQEIGQIVRERSQQDRTKVFDVILPLDDFDPELLRPGMGVKVRIETETHENVLLIPLSALDVRTEGPGIWKKGRGQAEWTPVELGPRNDERVVVLSGLEAGDELEVRG